MVSTFFYIDILLFMSSKIEHYNFPPNNPAPFDEQFGGHFFAYAKKFSNLGHTLSHFSFDTFVKFIPTGYKTIIVNQRELLFENGKIKIDWRTTNNENQQELKNEYILYLESKQTEYIIDWKREVTSFTIRQPKATTADFKSISWIDKNECHIFGMEFSKKNHCKVLLAKVLETISWH